MRVAISEACNNQIYFLCRYISNILSICYTLFHFTLKTADVN